jgi:hypothetical protein
LTAVAASAIAAIAVPLSSVLRPLVPVIISLASMLSVAHWLQREWAVDSLPVLFLQCLLAGCLYLVFAVLIVIKKKNAACSPTA